ncbi:MAG: YraN family protein [Prevotella sp.]|nr:YraN family protein [Prevotella sp.]
MAAHNELGLWGEEVAAEYLQRQGYALMERNWHSGHRDIDIVAWDGTEVVFVEVKTRQSASFISPEQAVDWRKRRSLQLSVNHYVKWHNISRYRIDVVTVVGSPGTGTPQVNHIRDFRISMPYSTRW